MKTFPSAFGSKTIVVLGNNWVSKSEKETFHSETHDAFIKYKMNFKLDL